MISSSKLKMVKSKIDKQLANLKKSIMDEIIDNIKTLDLDNEEIIIDKINEKKIKSKRKAPKIPIDKQCNKICKNGLKCTVPICYKKTCWAHLAKEDKELYRKTKNLN